MVYALALFAVILLDTLCVKFVFPRLPRMTSQVSFLQAFIITSVSATLIGIILLEFVGGLLVYPFLQHLGIPQKLAYVLIKNSYLTLSPLLSAIALRLWTRLVPSLGFYRLWPDALLAGLLLDFVDHGIVVPWFFRIAEAFTK